MNADTTDYRALFLAAKPLLDTRAPTEFARGSFPGAVNLPLMNDAERAAVGTCYKQSGQQAALALGHRLVSGDVKAQRVNDWLEFVRRNPAGYLYCFRGGLRSQICQQWLREAGCDYPRILGGYKAMRRFLLQTLDHVSVAYPLLVLGGRTGCGKTELLTHVAGAVDLEKLAHHRGSAFGRHVREQPPQIDFENALAVALLKCTTQHAEGAVVVEDEGKLIGRLQLPLSLWTAMKAAPRVLVEAPFEARVAHSYDNYILDKLREWQQACGDDAGFAAFANDLRQSLRNILRRLGGERYSKALALLDAALASHSRGDPEPHREWIALLLQHYYDPMYDFQLQQHQQRIMFRGPAAEVLEFISGYNAQL